MNIEEWCALKTGDIVVSEVSNSICEVISNHVCLHKENYKIRVRRLDDYTYTYPIYNYHNYRRPNKKDKLELL